MEGEVERKIISTPLLHFAQLRIKGKVFFINKKKIFKITTLPAVKCMYYCSSGKWMEIVGNRRTVWKSCEVIGQGGGGTGHEGVRR